MFKSHKSRAYETCRAHVSPIENDRLLKLVINGELSTGHPDKGAPKGRYKGNLKDSLGACHIDHRQWSNLSADLDAWRNTTRKDASTFKVSRRGCSQEEGRRGFSRITYHQTRISPALDAPVIKQLAPDMDVCLSLLDHRRV